MLSKEKREMNKCCNVYIPSYHRPHNMKTVKYLKKIGWDMSRVTVFVDSETDDIAEYRGEAKSMGFNVHVFDMKEARERYEYVHRPSVSRRSAGQARNMFQDYARGKGVDFYLVFDDDTEYLATFPKRHMPNKPLELLVSVCSGIENLMRRKRIGVFGMTQTGDWMSGYMKPLFMRKVMNTTFYLLPYIYRGERGVQDDDTSLFTGLHNEGLFTGSLSHGLVLQQCQSATQEGGLTDLYNECKLLNKSLVCPIQYPSAIRAEKQIMNGGRLHHRINYRYLAPCILKGRPEEDNIAWDRWEEDAPFTNENKLKLPRE